MAKYSRDRLLLALQLLTAMPSHPTSTVEELMAELECPRATFYRLIADLRHAGFGIEKRYLETGKVSYFISGRDRALVDRILRLKKS